MLIYSKPGATTHYSINLPLIGRDYWSAPQKVNEASTIPTSTTSASIFRQVVKYGVSAIRKRYSVVVPKATADLLKSLYDSDQTAVYVDNGTATYDASINMNFTSISSSMASVDLEILVNSLKA